jgi:hypothetical protein
VGEARGFQGQSRSGEDGGGWNNDHATRAFFHRFYLRPSGQHFNKIGKDVDRRLEELGGTRVYDRGEGDDDGTLEDDFEGWKENVWPALQAAAGMAGAGKEASHGYVEHSLSFSSSLLLVSLPFLTFRAPTRTLILEMFLPSHWMSHASLNVLFFFPLFFVQAHLHQLFSMQSTRSLALLTG